ncbi:MAG: hypothetical protein V7772_13495 [Pseudomonas profundi]|uniref:hypothetical protein n=1 Tax=Pseudomonas profundi TaxID=1981513 RepID=UPI003001B9E7
MWKGHLSWIFQSRLTEDPIVCDVLLIHPSRESYCLGRKAPLVAGMEAAGLSVEQYVEDEDTRLLRNRHFTAPRLKVPFVLRWYASHAEYLVNKYEAKVILTERNGWVVPTFIKYLRRSGPKVVHLAHSIPSGESTRYGYFDYDHYLIFGQSSYDYLSKIEDAFGSCAAHFAGPYFFSDWEGRPNKSRLVSEGQLRCLFLGGGPAYETSGEYLQYCSWLIDWLTENPGALLYIKVHPRGAGIPWINESVKNPRIKILPLDTSLERCAADFDLIFSGYTNAIIDVARSGTPFMLLGSGEDYFSAEKFGIFRAKSPEELVDCICRVFLDRNDYISKVMEFYDFHVHERSHPRTAVLDIITKLTTGSAPAGRRLGCR